MVVASELGSERVSNGREHMSQRGKRVSIRKGKYTEVKMKNAIGRESPQATHKRIRVVDCLDVSGLPKMAEVQVPGKEALNSQIILVPS